MIAVSPDMLASAKMPLEFAGPLRDPYQVRWLDGEVVRFSKCFHTFAAALEWARENVPKSMSQCAVVHLAVNVVNDATSVSPSLRK